MRGPILGLFAGVLIFAPLGAVDLDIAGGWTLNRDLTTMPAQGESERRPEGGRRGGMGGPGGGGIGGRGVGGGGVGGRGGIGGGAARPGEGELRKLEVVRRRLSDIPDRLIIVRDGDSVTITDGFGRTYKLKADGKKQERVTGDGEFKSKAHFEGSKLILEEDFGGPKVITTYTPVLEGGEIRRLEVRLKAEGLPGAGRERLAGRSGAAGSARSDITRVYDAELR